MRSMFLALEQTTFLPPNGVSTVIAIGFGGAGRRGWLNPPPCGEGRSEAEGRGLLPDPGAATLPQPLPTRGRGLPSRSALPHSLQPEDALPVATSIPGTTPC